MTDSPIIIPPDRQRCQGEIRSFMQLGGKAFIRCENKPAVIITEKEATTCGQHGSMSLCEDCFDAFKERDGRDVDIEPIAPLFEEVKE